MLDYTKTPITIEQAKKTRQAFQSALEGGQIVPQKALITKQIEAVSSESGTIQDTPFINQATGTANGTVIVDTSPVGKHVEKQGNSVVYNNKIRNGDFSNGKTSWFDGGNVSMTVSNGVASIVNTGSVAPVYQNVGSAILGHKYLVSYTCRTESGTVTGGYGYGANYKTSVFTFTTDKKAFFSILQPSTTDGYFYIYLTSGTIYVDDVFLIDLTQWFGSNDLIPSDLLSHPEHFSWHYNGSYSYNVGQIKDCAGRYLECGQSRNVWDEVVSNESSIGADGSIVSDLHKFASTNLIPVIPNSPYYFKMPYSIAAYFIRIAWYDKNKNVIDVKNTYTATNIIVSPENAWYMRFATGDGSTTYNHDITISLYYTTGDSYDEYFPYVAPKTYDTGTEVLRRAGSAKDIKLPDGTIIRNVGVVDLGSLDWISDAIVQGNNRFYADLGGAKQSDTTNGVTSICTKYIALAQGGTSGGAGQTAIGYTISSAGNIFIHDTALQGNTADEFKTAMSGVMLYYELATPTTEQGTPFSENIEINDYSYMAWNDTNDDLVEIPQGCKIFYPADYVLLIDSLNALLNGDVDKIFTRYKHTIELRADSTDHIDLTFYFVSSDATKIEGASGLTFLSTNYKFMQIDGIDSVNGQKIIGIYLWSGTTLQLLEIDGNNNMVFVTYSDITISGTPSDTVAEI